MQYSPEVVFVATDHPMYMATIGKSTNTERRPNIESVLQQGLRADFIIPELYSAASLVFAWNPTNTHWVVAQVMWEVTATIRIYDSARKHQATSGYEAELRQFLALVAKSHPSSTFANGYWNTAALTYEKTIQQNGDDCGIYAAWNAKMLRGNKQPPSTCRMLLDMHATTAFNAFDLGRALRLELLREEHSIITGSVTAYWLHHGSTSGSTRVTQRRIFSRT
jgi:hypothetical protein